MTRPAEGSIEPARSQVPQRVDFTFWTEEKLRNADTDQFKHINNAVVASLFEAGRMELFNALLAEEKGSEVGLVVVRLLMNFHQELHYPGTVAIGSVITRVGNASFDASQGLFRDQACVASATATCVLIHEQTRRPYPVPDALRHRMLRSGARS